MTPSLVDAVISELPYTIPAELPRCFPVRQIRPHELHTPSRSLWSFSFLRAQFSVALSSAHPQSFFPSFKSSGSWDSFFIGCCLPLARLIEGLSFLSRLAPCFPVRSVSIECFVLIHLSRDPPPLVFFVFLTKLHYPLIVCAIPFKSLSQT